MLISTEFIISVHKIQSSHVRERCLIYHKDTSVIKNIYISIYVQASDSDEASDHELRERPTFRYVLY